MKREWILSLVLLAAPTWSFAQHKIELPADSEEFYQFSYSMKAGTTKTEVFSIKNTEESDFKLGEIQTYYYDNVRARTNCPLILKPGQRCQLKLYFTPKTVGIVAGQGARFSDARFAFAFYANTY